MTRDELIHAVTAERFSGPVREWKPADRPRPLAEQLDDLRDYGTAVLEIVDRTA